MKRIVTTLLILSLFINAQAQNDSLTNVQDSLSDEFSSMILNESGGSKGEVGSFGKRLSQLASFVSLNGYATNEYLSYQNGVNTFSNHYFNLIASAEISPRIFAEIQMEYEYGGSSVNARYAQIDYKISDMFIVRSGKFLVPAGEFNEYLYPEYLSKIVSRAFVNREIIPVSWEEVGVQLRGELKIHGDSSLVKPFYAIYVVNGLKSANPQNTSIRDMRGNVLDTLSGGLAYGGNIGAEIGKYFNIQFNYYKGDYNPAGDANLAIYGTSLAFDNGKFSFYGELHAANQEFTVNGVENDLSKYGFYAQLAYKYNKIEPVLRYDQIRLDGLDTEDRDRITLGLNYHLYQNAVLKVNYELISNKGVDVENNLFSVQLAVGF